jgi:hypothetical protein
MMIDRDRKRILICEKGVGKEYIVDAGRYLHPHGVSLVSFSPDKNILVTASYKTVFGWKKPGVLLWTMTAHTKEVNAIVVMEQEKIVSGGDDGRMIISQKGIVLSTVGIPGRILAINPDLVCAWVHNDNICFLDTELPGNVVWVGQKTVVVGDNEGRIRSWDVMERKQQWTGHAHRDRITAIASWGNRIVTVSDDTTTIIWDKNNGTIMERFFDHAAPVTCCALTDSCIVTGGRDGRVKIRHQGLENTFYFESYPQGVSVRDGNVLIGLSNGSVHGLSLLPGPIVRTIYCPETPLSACRSLDGSIFVIGTENEKVMVVSETLVKIVDNVPWEVCSNVSVGLNDYILSKDSTLDQYTFRVSAMLLLLSLSVFSKISVWDIPDIISDAFLWEEIGFGKKQLQAEFEKVIE